MDANKIELDREATNNNINNSGAHSLILVKQFEPDIDTH
jgi:hypothetical protein